MKPIEVKVRRKAEVTLRPVFRYAERRGHGHAWMWLTGAAVLVAVVVTVVLPQMV